MLTSWRRSGGLVLEPVKQELTFRVLDDLALGMQRGRADASTVLPMFCVGDIGPLVELIVSQRVV